MKKTTKKSDDNKIPSRGYFYVQKVNILAKFSFGKSGSFDSMQEAFEAMNNYLAKRSDRDSLTVGFFDLVSK